MNWEQWFDMEEAAVRQERRKPERKPALQDDEEYSGPLASFYADRLIVGEPVVVKSGKEATVYCCPAHPSTGKTWLAAKVYRPRQQRSFKKDGVYQQGRTTLDKRLDKAIAQKSRKGLETQFATWLGQEYGTLRQLYAAGADVPQPFACAGSALLIEYFGEIGMPAPQLINVELPPAEAPPLFEQMMRNLAILLDCDRVHGDLSSYNILYWQGGLKIIDFPQAVDPAVNPEAFSLFERDVENVCDYFAHYGVASDPWRLARTLWIQSGRRKP